MGVRRQELQAPVPTSTVPVAAVPPPAQPESLYYEVALQEIGRLYQAAGEGDPLRVGSLQRIVATLVQNILADDALLVRALECGESELDRARHMLNTAIFAVKIAQGSGCREEELPWLGLAGCLHDVGMGIVPARIVNKSSGLTEEEQALIRMHPEKGFRILQTLGPEYEWLANVVLQHQEREDGSGYPRGLTGDEIHEFAKIIGLADTYEALTHPRPYRAVARSPLEIAKEIINSERGHFPNHILKGFLRGLSTFPVGSWVRLNTGEGARIVVTNAAFPLRPVVEILTDAKGERVDPPRRVDLAANTLLYVTQSGSSPKR
jgi:HD-GYP domain-containing protein (c-di-GMP phosphodiesterase class II)